jgi:anti-anti-sigma factor
MSTSAELALETREGAVVARVSGEVDMTNARWLGEELARSVPNEALRLVVDLGDTRYLDSAGIELVFELARRLGRRRQELRLVVPESSPLRRVLGLTDVASVAGVHSSLEEALTG